MQLRVKLGVTVPIKGGIPNVGMLPVQTVPGNQIDACQGWLLAITTNPQAQIQSS